MIKPISYRSVSPFSFLCYSNNIYKITKPTLYITHTCQSFNYFHSYSYLDSLVSSIVFAVRTCSSISSCRSLHCRVIKSLKYSDGFLGDQLVSLYLKLGFFPDAYKLFDEMPEKDLVSWNSLISTLLQEGCVANCFYVFSKMRYEIDIFPNEVTLLSMISAYIDMRPIDDGKCIHGLALKLGLLCVVKVPNSLINMYGKFAHVDAASQLFETMPLKNLVSWNSMVAIYIQKGLACEAMQMLNVLRRGYAKPDEATLICLNQACEELNIGKLAESVHGLILKSGFFGEIKISTGVLNLYAKLGKLKESHKVFNEIISPDKIAWTALIASYAVHGVGKQAIKVFEVMVKKNVEPDHVTFTHLLSACSHSGLINEGKKYFKVMDEVYRVKPRLDHYSCMVDLLGRDGQLNEAYELIKGMPIEPNSGIWGALLGACRVYGNVAIGQEVAKKMIGLDPEDSRNYVMLSNMYFSADRWKDAWNVRVLMKDRGLARISGCSFIGDTTTDPRKVRTNETKLTNVDYIEL